MQIKAQPLTLLKKIGQVDPNTESGLGLSFIGSELQDGWLYFRASHDGFDQAIWKTDGTPAGTQKVVSESTTDGWSLFEFVPEGIFLQTFDDHLLFYDVTSASVKDLGFFEDENFLRAQRFEEDSYIFFTRNEDTANLFVTNMTAAGTYKLGSAGPHVSFMTMYASPYGAVVYNTNSFSSYVPVIYEAATGQIKSVVDFLAPYKVVSSVKEVVVYDHYMFLRVVEGGFTKLYTFDMRSHTFYPGNNFFGVIEAFYPHDDKLIIVSEREIVTLDTTTFAMTEWTEDVYPLGLHLVDGDTIYYHGYTAGDIIKFHTFDLNTNTISILENSEIGQSHYNGAFDIHKDQLYYTYETGQTIFLRKYDFTDEDFEEIDSISVRSGGWVVSNGVVDINDKLLVSKFSPEIGHELYWLSGSVGITQPGASIPEVMVFPNPASDKITLKLQGPQLGHVVIYDALGRERHQAELKEPALTIAHLAAGQYYGMLRIGEKRYRFSFVKLK